ncbi:hypothetical protein J6E39_04285 [bacterium]|nr:hypothetical protein [bacterium]
MKINGDNTNVREIVSQFKAFDDGGKIEKRSLLNGKINQAGGNCKRVTAENMEAAQLMRPTNAVKYLLGKSPIGLGKMPERENIENSGYSRSNTSFHKGAPTIYESSDGGVVTVYPGGGTAEMGEDKKKVVYQTDRFIQEMYYDDNGKLTGGQIKIKDNVAGFLEAQYDFTADENGNLKSVIQ